jgi:hypothetical protein
VSDDLLLRRIQNAQVEAAEDVLVEDLRRKGLLPPGPKLALVAGLDQLRDLMREFTASPDVEHLNPLETKLLFSSFLVWLRKRQEKMIDESKNGATNLRLAPSVDRR